jgi:Cytochrome D1 heme domain
MPRFGGLSAAILGALLALVDASATDAAAPRSLAAQSADGRWVLQAQRDPPCLWVVDAQQRKAVRAIAPVARDGRAVAIAALRVAPQRRSFVVAPQGVPELWEISYDPRAEEIYDGIVHDWRFGEGVPRPGFFGLRRIALPAPLQAFVFDEHEAEAWGLAQASSAGGGEGLVINLDVRRHIATVPASTVHARLREAQVPPLIEGLARRGAPCTVTPGS